ncbi:MAG: acetylglutamate kinase [Fimbriiglobus sp.]
MPGTSAEILLQAARQVRKWHGRVRVVKLGGSAMEDPIATRATLEAVVALQSFGLQVALVHGGGKAIDRAMAEAGVTPVKIQGRRYTDEATLKIVCEVLAELNASIEATIDELGGVAEGYRDWDTFPVNGKRLMLPGLDLAPVDLGRVGYVMDIDSDIRDSLTERLAIPVIPSLAFSLDDGLMLNVNADTVAAGVAKGLGAEEVIFLTDTPGVLKDHRNPKTLYPTLTRAECEALIASGVIAGGMIPKVEACFEALEAGAVRAVIRDGRNPHTLLSDFTGELSGTTITR